MRWSREELIVLARIGTQTPTPLDRTKQRLPQVTQWIAMAALPSIHSLPRQRPRCFSCCVHIIGCCRRALGDVECGESGAARRSLSVETRFQVTGTESPRLIYVTRWRTIVPRKAVLSPAVRWVVDLRAKQSGSERQGSARLAREAGFSAQGPSPAAACD